MVKKTQMKIFLIMVIISCTLFAGCDTIAENLNNIGIALNYSSQNERDDTGSNLSYDDFTTLDSASIKEGSYICFEGIDGADLLNDKVRHSFEIKNENSEFTLTYIEDNENKTIEGGYELLLDEETDTIYLLLTSSSGEYEYAFIYYTNQSLSVSMQDCRMALYGYEYI